MRRIVAMAAPPVLLAWLSLAEWKIIERLLYADAASVGFVVESVRGVLAGTPVSKSWAHRVVAPLLVSLFGGANEAALERFAAGALVAANVLLFFCLRRRGVSLVGAAHGVVAFGLARFVLAYKLEYPWDGVDQLVFLTFGAWVARGGGLSRLAPLLVLGAFNHETILYVPLWYVLAGERKQRLAASGVAAAMATAIAITRAARYVGPPNLPGQVFEPPTPIVENHLHVAHNLRELFVRDWIAGRAHLSLAFFGATAAFVWLARRIETRVAAVWSLVVLGTVVAFGYVNETRHYLLLVAFWIAYAWRDRSVAVGLATERRMDSTKVTR
ncbi:MAG: hypothetical protein KF819_06165 [Labilithrix sp.]|nr:hypothetical protein [Labilithrix sp.]